jgi:hypothetical protein
MKVAAPRMSGAACRLCWLVSTPWAQHDADGQPEQCRDDRTEQRAVCEHDEPCVPSEDEAETSARQSAQHQTHRVAELPDERGETMWLSIAHRALTERHTHGQHEHSQHEVQRTVGALGECLQLSVADLRRGLYECLRGKRAVCVEPEGIHCEQQAGDHQSAE